LNASWLEFTGTGNVTSTVLASTIANTQPGSVDVDNSKVHRHYFALGLGLELGF
jgi:hypothetical protein